MDGIFLYILVALVIFAFLREVHCWFWKINKIVELLEKMERELNGVNLSLSDIRGKVDAINRQGADRWHPLFQAGMEVFF